ncbi:hypothetical protein ACS0TY_028003 [Phlomoides rotata]
MPKISSSSQEPRKIDSYTSKDQALNFFTTITFSHPWFRAICLSSCVVKTISRWILAIGDARVGYVVAYGHWGKGIATQAIKMVEIGLKLLLMLIMKDDRGFWRKLDL